MESNILFAAHIYNFRPIWIVLPIVLFVMLMLLSLIPSVPFTFDKVRKTGKIFLCIQCFLLLGHFYAFATELIPYYLKQYSTVEGNVENYTAPTNPYNKSESFSVGGVEFDYNYNEITFGYHDTKLDKGIINEDTKGVRIVYIHNALNAKNIIMRIEKMS